MTAYTPPEQLLLEDPNSGQPWTAAPDEWRDDEELSQPSALLRQRRWRFGPRSLTGRLVTGVVTLVAVLVVATGASTYFALRSFLYNRLDQQLTPLAANSQNRFAPCLVAQAQACQIFNDPGAYRATQTEWLTVFDGNGQLVYQIPSNDVVQPMLLTTAQRAVLVEHPNSTKSLTTTDGARLRVAARQVNTVSGSYVVVTGLSTDEVRNTLHRLIVLEWIIGGSAVILAFAATFGGVQWSLRRLRRVTATAHEVAAELSPQGTGLDRRVPVDDDDTTEVGQLAESMNTLLAAVESQFGARLESEQRMRQFLADASHELRTPLTSIRGYAELARMQRGKQSDGDDPANLDRIESEGTRMSRLIDDLLLLARTDQAGDEGTVQVREYVEVDELLADVVSGARASFPARQIDLSVSPGLALIGDPDQLHRAVRNLVNNAAVHTRADGPIGVRAVHDADDVLIQVADSGPGLSPQDAAHVFERFWRADKARTRVRGGSGLGMSIVSSIVGSHGGTVRFDSSVETGSTVTIRLPSGIG
jgi:two-component system OmpR family sensor kinase